MISIFPLKITPNRYVIVPSFFVHVDEPVRGYKNFSCVLVGNIPLSLGPA